MEISWKNTPCMPGGHGRLWWIRKHGPLPSYIHVCHHCDNGWCKNLEHMFIGTRKDNMQDCSKKGRIRNGSQYVETRLAISIANSGSNNGMVKLAQKRRECQLEHPCTN